MTCFFCDEKADISLCIGHFKALRFPKIHQTKNNDFPEEDAQCLFEYGETYVGSYSKTDNRWYDEDGYSICDTEDDVLWIELPYLESWLKKLTALKEKKLSGAEKEV